MPRPLFDTPYIFGLHDPGGENLMAQANRRGWIVFTVEVGSDPNNQSGFDFSPWASQDFGIICRINNGYGSAGTIPYSSQYANFARRVANFVAASSGCKIWVIGNEMNHSQEWPAVPSATAAAIPGVSPSAAPAATPRLQPARGRDADPTGHGSTTRFSALHPTSAAAPAAAAAAASFEPITPTLYANCFRQCRDAIKLTPGHGDDQVAIGAVAPWNNQVTYATNPTGDWVKYFADILALLGDGGLDAITLHTYTHGSDPALVTDTSTMNAPFQNRYFNFQAYRNFMDAVPPAMRSLPAYITETDQDVPWLDQNNGWVRAAYAEIDRWNQQGNAQQIRVLALYRWPPYDKWYIQGKQGVINDFTEAMRNDYRWKAPPPKPADFAAGDTVRTLDIVNFRQTPGGSALAQLPLGSELKVISSRYTLQNGLIWWNLRRTVDGGGTQDGWVAQVSPDGIVLLEKVMASLPSGSFKPGDQVQTQTVVRMRKTPGTTNKPSDDVVADVPQGTVLTVLSGPTTADGMTWWRNQGKMPDGTQVIGWQAEKLPDGTVLLALYAAVPVPPSIELPPATFRPGERFTTTTVVNLRRSAGSSNKPANDVVASLPQGSEGTIVSGPVQRDGMTWWEVRMAGGQSLQGWMAEALPSGEQLMQRLAAQAGTFAKGDLAVTSDFANVRRTPGITGKPGDDVLGMFAPRAVVNVAAGPESKDNLTWWRVGGISSSGVELIGYVAERTPDGAQLLAPAPKLPNTSIPDKASSLYLAAPYDGSYGITQLWGENPSFYSKFNYDGVALRGHNGIDFMTPTGTLIYATDAGEVAQVGFEDGGFGNYILIRHSWGESIYAHLASTAVIPGQAVGRGQYIGGSDNTGGSSGPHLHFAIRVNPYQRTDGWGGFTDPLPYLPPNSFVLPPYVLDPASLAIAAALPAPTNARDARQAPSSMGSVPGAKRP